MTCNNKHNKFYFTLKLTILSAYLIKSTTDKKAHRSYILPKHIQDKFMKMNSDFFFNSAVRVLITLNCLAQANQFSPKNLLADLLHLDDLALEPKMIFLGNKSVQ